MSALPEICFCTTCHWPSLALSCLFCHHAQVAPAVHLECAAVVLVWLVLHTNIQRCLLNEPTEELYIHLKVEHLQVAIRMRIQCE